MPCSPSWVNDKIPEKSEVSPLNINAVVYLLVVDTGNRQYSGPAELIAVTGPCEMQGSRNI